MTDATLEFWLYQGGTLLAFAMAANTAHWRWRSGYKWLYLPKDGWLYDVMVGWIVAMNAVVVLKVLNQVSFAVLIAVCGGYSIASQAYSIAYRSFLRRRPPQLAREL